MANLKEIQNKIRSVKNTQKTTKAMKLVSSSKMLRTSELRAKSEPYSKKISKVFKQISSKIVNTKNDTFDRVFVPNDKPKVVDIICITADKGLCGGFNIHTLKQTKSLIEKFESDGVRVHLRVCGKKGIDYLKFGGYKIIQSINNLSSHPDFNKAKEFLSECLKDFEEEKSDKIIFVYNGYFNMLNSKMNTKDIFPIQIDDNEKPTNEIFDIEPDDNDLALLKELSTQFANFSFYYALLDSLCAEHAARMQAMDAASKNADEKYNELQLEYNKTRQAAITTELVEIISGVESLK